MLAFVLFIGFELFLVLAGTVYLYYRTFRLVPREVFLAMMARQRLLSGIDLDPSTR